MRTKLDPATLRWLANQAHKAMIVFPMHQHGQGFNQAMTQVKVACREEARTIERAKKPRRKTK